MSNKKIFISAGEASGDLHGANLIKGILEQAPGVEIYGLGRQRMVETGLHCLHSMDNHSVMWAETLTRIPALWGVYKDCVNFFQSHRPQMVVLIDYAGFNLYLAQAARKLGIPVVYYICPQLWAHGAWRVKKLKRLVSKVLVIYPFEEGFYTRAGIPVRYVGHPLFDELAKRELDKELIEKLRSGGDSSGTKNSTLRSPHSAFPVVSILTGSRSQEIKKLLPLFLKAAGLIRESLPESRFLISCGHIDHIPLIHTMVKRYGLDAETVVGSLGEIIEAATLCLTASGTVTLEVAYHQKPMIVAYRVTPFAYFVAKPYMDTPFLSLVNTVAEKFLVPEKFMYRDDYHWVARQALELLIGEGKRDGVVQGLKRIMEDIARPGASALAAREILGMV
ncbi:MAG TPA: lipid-A-disaccharide synthase [Candidatus Tripitaka californicus]|uniref:lipid-A-disaccharide synthase n=1 Tax=Candidatus Tripitaka californicus TaxID=3367616 RepID=UPI00402A4E3C